jgi:hypothetical protein
MNGKGSQKRRKRNGTKTEKKGAVKGVVKRNQKG